MGNFSTYEMKISLMYYPGAFGRRELKVTLTPWPTHEYYVSFWQPTHEYYTSFWQPIMVRQFQHIALTLQDLWEFVIHDVINHAPYPEMFEDLTWENFVN